MSYETGTYTNIADLFSRLNTFATAAGWTVNHSAADRLFLTKSTVSVAFRWSTTSPTCAAIYQHTAFVNSATDPGNHTNDSGQGAISGTDATLLTGRHVVLPNTSARYWFFANGDSVHAVVETAPLRVTHFGFGMLTKKGTWTGGAYAYGSRFDAGGPISVGHSVLLDGLAGLGTEAAVRPFVGTVHVEGMPGQAGAGRWGLAWGGTIATTSTDRAGNAREMLQGGFRGGPLARQFSRFGGAVNTGAIVLYSIGVWLNSRAVAARWHELGHMPDVRGVNLKNFTVADEVTIGGDVWVLFPTRFKTSVSPTSSSKNQGIAYRKVL